MAGSGFGPDRGSSDRASHDGHFRHHGHHHHFFDHHHKSRAKFHFSFAFGVGHFFWGGWCPWWWWDPWWWWWPPSAGFAAYHPAPVYYPVSYPQQTIIIDGGGYGAAAPSPYDVPAPDAARTEAEEKVGPEEREEMRPEFSALVAGDLAFRNGEYDKAIDHYERAVVLDPEAALPRFALGEALFVKRNYAYAAFVIRKGLELDGSWLDVRAPKDKIYGKLADYAVALNRLESYVAEHPYDAAAKFVLGYQYFVTGKYAQAKEVLTAARALGPDPAADLILEKIEERLASPPAEKPAGAPQTEPKKESQDEAPKKDGE